MLAVPRQRGSSCCGTTRDPSRARHGNHSVLEIPGLSLQSRSQQEASQLRPWQLQVYTQVETYHPTDRIGQHRASVVTHLREAPLRCRMSTLARLSPAAVQ
jgi:hypothetical protein